jgi:hypothetical protein
MPDLLREYGIEPEPEAAQLSLVVDVIVVG